MNTSAHHMNLEERELVAKLHQGLKQMFAPGKGFHKLFPAEQWDGIKDSTLSTSKRAPLSDDNIPLLNEPKEDAQIVSFGWSEYSKDGSPTKRAVPMAYGFNYNRVLGPDGFDDDASSFKLVYVVAVLASRTEWAAWLTKNQ